VKTCRFRRSAGLGFTRIKVNHETLLLAGLTILDDHRHRAVLVDVNLALGKGDGGVMKGVGVADQTARLPMRSAIMGIEAAMRLRFIHKPLLFVGRRSLDNARIDKRIRPPLRRALPP